VSTRPGGCRLLFNTSDATLRGSVDARGRVAVTPGGQPVAVFAFDSIELGPEVNVTLVGQRPLVLLSRSSVVLNTTLAAKPGTLGGFLGGFSWGRLPSDALSDDPLDLHLRNLPTEVRACACGGGLAGVRLRRMGEMGVHGWRLKLLQRFLNKPPSS
jgi:hypothetical protein